jgi:site-specific DNA-methyltransferase (adenine-specific)
MQPDYTSEGVTLYRADCLQAMAAMAPASVDVLVTDPPYFLPARHYSLRTGTARSLSDLSILEHFYRDVFTAVRRILKPTGFAYVFCDGQSYPVFYVAAYPHFRALRPLIWDKQISINGYSWRHQHELILFAESEDAPAVKTGDGDIVQCRAVPVEQRMHPAEKPVALLRRFIEKSTPEDGVVCDPFMGSGATGEAARQARRAFMGMESDLTYFTGAQQRISATVWDSATWRAGQQAQRGFDTLLGDVA